MKKFITIVALIVASVYFSLQVKFHYKLNNDYTIIQTENTKDKKIPDYINKKYPLVINKLMNEEHVLFNLSIDILYSMCRGKFANFNIQDDDPNNYKKPTLVNIDAIPNFIKNNQKWKCVINHEFMRNFNLYQTINELFKPIHPKLSFKPKYSIKASSKKYIEPLQYSENYKTVITQLSGTKLVRLFSPENCKNLYLDERFNPNLKNSKINIWLDHNELYKKYPKLKETEFIDIILRPGNTLIIPNFWLYSTQNLKDSVSLHCELNTIFSYLIQIPNSLLNLSHEFGLYKNKNCYCHN